MNKIKVIIIFLIILQCISFTREIDNEEATNSNMTSKDVRKESEKIEQNIVKPIKKVKEVFFEEISRNTNEALLMVEIDKINLKRSVYKVDSKENIVDKNVAIMKESDLPDIESGNLILGAHSGDGPLAYFNNLIKLRKNDEINISYNNKVYTYEVATIYDDIKDNKIVIRRDMKKTTLTLFTCKNNEKNKYLVIIAYLKK